MEADTETYNSKSLIWFGNEFTKNTITSHKCMCTLVGKCHTKLAKSYLGYSKKNNTDDAYDTGDK